MNKRLIVSACIAALVPGVAAGQTYSIGSNPQGSLAYSAAAGVAKVASEDGGIKARVVPQGGPVVTLPRVEKGQLDFSIAVSLVAAFGKEGRAMFKGKKQENVRIAAVLFPLRLGFFVRKDSGITKISQLKGKRLGSKFTKQKVVGITGAAKLATAGLTYKDVKPVPVPNGVRQVDDFMAGKIDAVTFSLASAKTRQANASVGGIRVLSLPNTPESLAAMQKVAPGSLIQTIQPGPRYPGVEGPTNIFVMPFILTASAKTPDAIVYKVVKALHGNKKKLVSVHKAFGDFEGAKMHLDIGLPYHPGALKFYKEKGL